MNGAKSMLLLALGLAGLPAMALEPDFVVDIGWDSRYITEGRDNLAGGGIGWGALAASIGDFTGYARVGRADSEHYTEWNFGVEYALHLHDQIEAFVGLQRIESYGDERCNDTEFFAEMALVQWDYLVPSLAYTYSTEAGGYFVELSLHSNWHLGERLTLSPYITQGLDYQYVTEAHNGRNHLQFGVEAEYALADGLAITGHISRTQAGHDITLELGDDGLDETFAGVHLNWAF